MSLPTDISKKIILVSVEDKDTAELEIEFDSVVVEGKVKVLTLLVIDADSKNKELIDLIIAPGAGATQLIEGLLTSDQWDAVCNA